MKTNKFITKKNLLFAALGSVVIATPMVLTSCSNVRTKLLNATINKGDGNNFTSNLSLSDISFNSLKYTTGQQEFLDYIANKLAFQWMEFAAEQDNQAQYANLLKEQKRTVNEDYDDLVDSYKESDSKNWDLNLQQKELDPNGGTVANYKEKKHLEWAKTQLSTKLFENDYSTLVNKNDNSQVQNKPAYTDIVNVLKGTGDYVFGFSGNAIQTTKYDPTNADIEYAKFQKFIFDKWVEIENPFVVNMSLWKYGTPTETNGISDWYNVEATTSDDNTGDDTTTTSSATTLADDTTGDGSGDGEGDSTTTTPTAGTYTNPYFQMPNTSDGNSTVQKYKNFITASKTNNNFELKDASDIGLKRISNDYTEDSSTYILAKNGSIYSDLYPEFAAASSYLYGSQAGTTPVVTKKSISKKITETTDSNLGFDTITKEFVSESSFKTNDATDLNETHLDKSYVDQIIKENGPLNAARGKDLYVIDAYQVVDTNLNKFMMIRDEAGVHAISIDGDTYISKATTSSEAKTKAGDIVMYHSILGRQNYASAYNNGFTIDIKSELSTFFSDNMTYLILEYAQKTYGVNDNTKPSDSQQMFDLSKLFGELNDTYTSFAKALNNLLFNTKVENRQSEYIAKLYETKATYSANYGVNAYKNGLAARWIYSLDTNTTDNGLKVNSDYKYDLTNVVKSTTKTTELLSTYNTALSKFKTAITISPLKSDFSGFQYSEYIYTDNQFINAAIDGYLTDTTNITNDVKESALNSYIGNNLFDFTNYTFKDNSNVLSNGDNTTLDNVFSNLYFSSVFDSNTNKWMNLTSEYITNGANGTTSTISKDNLLKFKKYLWTESAKDTNTTTYRQKHMSLLTTVSSVKYLLDNNASKFIDWLSSKVTYGKNTFIVWENSQNTKLTNSTLTKTKSEDLLKGDSLQINSDNSLASGYIKELSTTTTNNTSSNAIVDNTKQSVFGYSTDYYNVVGGYVGFKGIQSNAANSLSSVITNRLFTNDKINNENSTGILNGYISKNDLLNYVDILTSLTAVNDLANELSSKLSLDLSKYNKSGLSLKQKKETLKDILNKANITDEMFKSRNGYIGDGTDNTLISDASPNSQMQYGAKVIQLNRNDITSKDKLLSTLNTVDSTNAKEIFYSLLVEAAMDTDIQNQMLSTVSSTNKVEVFDKRTNNALGTTWASNWKYKND